MAQTCHGMPVAGSLNRLPGPRVRAAVSKGPRALRRRGFRWLIIRTDEPGPGDTDAGRILQDAAGAIVAEEGTRVLIDLEQWP